MNCTHCGQPLAPGTFICPRCSAAQPQYPGAPAGQPGQGAPYSGQPQGTPPPSGYTGPPQAGYGQGYYGSAPWTYTPSPPTSVALVLGIISLALVILAFPLALPCSIVGLALSGSDRRKGARYVNVGVGLSVAALVISALAVLCVVVVFFVAFNTLTEIAGTADVYEKYNALASFILRS